MITTSTDLIRHKADQAEMMSLVKRVRSGENPDSFSEREKGVYAQGQNEIGIEEEEDRLNKLFALIHENNYGGVMYGLTGDSFYLGKKASEIEDAIRRGEGPIETGRERVVDLDESEWENLTGQRRITAG